MAFDATKNFAFGIVQTPPSPAGSGNTFVMTNGDGAKFPTPPFNVLMWPGPGTFPTSANSEIGRVTNISTDTLTISRQQESSNARQIIQGDYIALVTTTKTITDIESAINTNTANIATLQGEIPAGTIVDTTSAQTLTNKTLTSPKIGTNILDTNGNPIIVLSPNGSAVNQVTITNSVTGQPVQIKASGTDSNISLDLRGTGNGVTMLEGVRQDRSSGSTTNTWKPRLVIQYGWFFITGDGAASEFDFAITFPIAFAVAEYSITFGGLNGKAASDPTSQSDLGGTTGTTTAATTGIKSQTNTGCTAHVVFLGGAPSNGVRVGIAWTAVGAI